MALASLSDEEKLAAVHAIMARRKPYEPLPQEEEAPPPPPNPMAHLDASARDALERQLRTTLGAADAALQQQRDDLRALNELKAAEEAVAREEAAAAERKFQNELVARVRGSAWYQVAFVLRALAWITGFPFLVALVLFIVVICLAAATGGGIRKRTISDEARPWVIAGGIVGASFVCFFLFMALSELAYYQAVRVTLTRSEARELNHNERCSQWPMCL